MRGFQKRQISNFTSDDLILSSSLNPHALIILILSCACINSRSVLFIHSFQYLSKTTPILWHFEPNFNTVFTYVSAKSPKVMASTGFSRVTISASPSMIWQDDVSWTEGTQCNLLIRQQLLTYFLRYRRSSCFTAGKFTGLPASYIYLHNSFLVRD